MNSKFKTHSNSSPRRQRPDSWQGIHGTQKTIYFEGRKLYYQAERAQQNNDFL